MRVPEDYYLHETGAVKSKKLLISRYFGFCNIIIAAMIEVPSP
jgi:hypothetical protein